jgi:hypothetical protein
MNLNVLPCILPAELNREMVLPAGRMAARLPAAVQGFNARTLARGILSPTLPALRCGEGVKFVVVSRCGPASSWNRILTARPRLAAL